jgi:hypothetical protein
MSVRFTKTELRKATRWVTLLLGEYTGKADKKTLQKMLTHFSDLIDGAPQCVSDPVSIDDLVHSVIQRTEAEMISKIKKQYVSFNALAGVCNSHGGPDTYPENCLHHLNSSGVKICHQDTCPIMRGEG